VEAGDDPGFHMKRISRGNENEFRDNELRDEMHIRLHNEMPNTPVGIYPEGSGIDPDMLILEANNFQDSDDDEIMAAHFRLYENCDTASTPTYDEFINRENWYYYENTQESIELTSLSISSLLNGNSVYCWQVRYRDSSLGWSTWSEPLTFQTSESQYTDNLLLNPGDEIIVIEPAWPAYKDCALNAGIKVRTIKTTLETKWEPSVEQINNAINENTKMIVLNYPNNPTGKILPRKLLDSIVQTAKEHDLYILSDEIYDEYSNDDWRSISIYGYEKSIITMSFSKSYAMTGYRIGYAIAEPSIIEKMSKLQALSLTNVSEPIQYVALKARTNTMTNSSYVVDNANLVRSRLEALIKIAKDIGL